MDRLVQRNVLALSGRAVEAAGDCDVLLLDKTGTITLGNRQATDLIPAPGVTPEQLADAAQLASLADETPEGRSIVVLAKERFGLRERDLHGAVLVPFSAHTRMSGIDLDGRVVRKGAADAIAGWVVQAGGAIPPELQASVDAIATSGGTPLVVAESGRAMGVVHLKDVVKEGMRERFDEMRRMGIRTVMITGDNPLTAKAIADEAGVDDFLAEATPEDKMVLIKREQAAGRLVAMTGDGTNDAPALAQADVGVAMNTGTQAAKEAGNMVDLDSNPTKLIEIVEIGKQLLITRGSLTTFSIANDVAKYFAIIPAMFAGAFPVLDRLNVMDLSSARSAILSAVIFNALIIVLLVPLALRGVRYRPVGAAALLRRNLLIYGVGRHRRAVHRHQARRPRPHRLRSLLMRRQLVPAVLAFLALTVLVGVLYPLAITGVSQLVFADKADGSLVRRDGVVVGSSLLGQSFSGDRWFQPRPSAAGDGYDGAASAASNLGPTNPDLIDDGRGAGRRLPEAERARGRRPRPCRRGDGVRLRPRPGHLAREREAAGAARRRRPVACRSRACWSSSTSTPATGRSASWASRA